jgi:RHS repeat-associated protein
LDQFSRVLDGDANDGSNNSATFNYTWLMNHQLNSTGVNNPLFQYVPQTGTVSYGTANADNGLTTITASSGSATMSYDGNLNLTYDGVNTLTYDVENRLIAAQNTAWGASTYLYDPLGQRKQKVVGVNTAMPVATDFVLAGGAEIADYYETSATWRLTVRGVGGLPLVTVVPGGAGSEEIVYVHHDLKGSTVALTEAGSNGPAEIYTYSDYGAPQSGSWLAYQYAGYRYDSETGLYYMPARSYSPALGRFLQADPSGFGGGFNLYAYTGNDPVNLTDSTGLCPDGGKLTITLSASIANPFMAVLGVPSLTVSAQSNVCSEDGPHIVRDAAVKALSSLNPGQDETNNVTPRDGNFAQVADPSKIDTKTWHDAMSSHATSKESPTIPGQSTFVVKLYNDPKRGNVVAVVYPNSDPRHALGLIPFMMGSTNVNVPAARAYLGCQ